MQLQQILQQWDKMQGHDCINYSNTTKNNILFIDVSASRRKPSSGRLPTWSRKRR